MWVSRDYVDAMQVEQITPNPSDTVAAGDRLVYTFPIDNPSSTLMMVFWVTPRDMLRLSGEAGVPNGPAVSWNPFSYP